MKVANFKMAIDRRVAIAAVQFGDFKLMLADRALTKDLIHRIYRSFAIKYHSSIVMYVLKVYTPINIIDL